MQLENVLALNARLTTVYRLKDLLAHIWDYYDWDYYHWDYYDWDYYDWDYYDWDYYDPGRAIKMLAEGCEVARQDVHPALLKFAEMLERHQYGIISHCTHQITHTLEGVHNKIKVIKRIAYGLHDVEYFALKVKQALPGRVESN